MTGVHCVTADHENRRVSHPLRPLHCMTQWDAPVGRTHKAPAAPGRSEPFAFELERRFARANTRHDADAPACARAGRELAGRQRGLGETQAHGPRRGPSMPEAVAGPIAAGPGAPRQPASGRCGQGRRGTPPAGQQQAAREWRLPGPGRHQRPTPLQKRPLQDAPDRDAGGVTSVSLPQ